MSAAEQQLREARDSADHFRRQLEDLQSQQREREIQRERETRLRREQARRNRMPSNRLSNGDVADFIDATNCHIAACQTEITSPQPGDGDEMLRTIESCNRTMSESIKAAHRARSIYDAITRETNDRIVTALRDQGLTEWADCLDTGDYSPMAI